MFPLASQQFEYVTPPRAFGATGPAGQVAAFTVSATAQYIDLSLAVNPPPYDASSAQGTSGKGAAAGQQGLIGHYVTIYADGVDLGVICGSTAASVSGLGAPALGNVGTLSASGTYTGATGSCYRIPSGKEDSYRLQVGLDKFLGVVASATGTCRLYRSSPDNI